MRQRTRRRSSRRRTCNSMMDRREALLLIERLKRRTRDPDVLTLCEYVHGTDVHGTVQGFRLPDAHLVPGVRGTSGGRDGEEKKMAPWAPRLMLMSGSLGRARQPCPGVAPEVRCSRCCGTVLRPRGRGTGRGRSILWQLRNSGDD